MLLLSFGGIVVPLCCGVSVVLLCFGVSVLLLCFWVLLCFGVSVLFRGSVVFLYFRVSVFCFFGGLVLLCFGVFSTAGLWSYTSPDVPRRVDGRGPGVRGERSIPTGVPDPHGGRRDRPIRVAGPPRRHPGHPHGI